MVHRKSFVLGFVIASLIFGSVALAAGGASQINVYFKDLRYVINGTERAPSPGLQGFIYNNSTYVPLRFIAETLGYDVSWDGATSTITLGGGAPGAEVGGTWLDSLKLFSSTSGFVYWGVRTSKLSDNQAYSHGFEITASQNGKTTVTLEYLLGASYKTFLATFGQTYDTRETEGTATVTLIGDGKELTSQDFESGSPILIRTDVSGVYRLVIQVEVAKNSHNFAVGLVNARLTQ